VLAKFADLIWNIILTLVLLAVLWGIGSWLWKAV
jgi:cbb3-type cytochrome oxidase subunit 3